VAVDCESNLCIMLHRD